jgi:sulfate adenylyltransferase subunit 2
MPLQANEQAVERLVRFRSLGCYPLTAAIESTASNMGELVAEMELMRVSERAGRLIDGDREASMEAKKTEGYF